jgi:hypothetical protein
MRLSISRAVRPLAARCVLAAPISTEKFVTPALSTESSARVDRTQRSCSEHISGLIVSAGKMAPDRFWSYPMDWAKRVRVGTEQAEKSLAVK